MGNICIVCGKQVERKALGKNYLKFCSQSCYRKNYREKDINKWNNDKKEAARRKARLDWDSKEDVFCGCCGKRIEYSVHQRTKFCSSLCSKKGYKPTPEILEKKRLNRRLWFTENRERINENRRRNYRTPYLARLEVLRNKYGMSEEEYESLRDKQKGCCAICGNSLDPPYVDHCHDTGTVRGLLCQLCNTAIGHFRENVEIMKRAICYVESYEH